jgi:hypothetical protein
MQDFYLDTAKQVLAQRDLNDYEVTRGRNQRRLTIRFNGKEVVVTFPATKAASNEAVEGLVFQQRLERHIAVLEVPAKTPPKVYPTKHAARRFAERVLEIPLNAKTTDEEALRDLASMGVNVGLLADTIASKLERSVTAIRAVNSKLGLYIVKGGDGFRYLMDGATVITVLPKFSRPQKKHFQRRSQKAFQ